MSRQKTINQKKLNYAHISLFFRELSLLFESGINLDEALFIMSDNSEDKQQKNMYRLISKKLDDGNTLCDALTSCGRFPVHALNMVHIGQTSGKLESVFIGLADYYERQDSLQKSVRSVLTYPLIMIAIMFFVLAVLIIKVLPIFASVFEEAGAQMPTFLKLITESTSFIVLILALLLVILILSTVLFISLNKRPVSSGNHKNFVYKLPFIRQLYKKIEVGNFTYSMALLLSGGIDLNYAVNMAGDMAVSSWAKNKCQQIKISMVSGKTFSQAVMKSDFLDGTFAALLAAGEKAGRTDVTVNIIADKYSLKISERINSLLAVIEPALVIIMSLIVGGILLSMMIPLINILTSM